MPTRDEVIAHVQAGIRSNLEWMLRRYQLRQGDSDALQQAALVVCTVRAGCVCAERHRERRLHDFWYAVTRCERDHGATLQDLARSEILAEAVAITRTFAGDEVVATVTPAGRDTAVALGDRTFHDMTAVTRCAIGDRDPWPHGPHAPWADWQVVGHLPTLDDMLGEFWQTFFQEDYGDAEWVAGTWHTRGDRQVAWWTEFFSQAAFGATLLPNHARDFGRSILFMIGSIDDQPFEQGDVMLCRLCNSETDTVCLACRNSGFAPTSRPVVEIFPRGRRGVASAWACPNSECQHVYCAGPGADPCPACGTAHGRKLCSVWVRR